MRTGTPFIANAKPSVSISFFDISPAIIGSAVTDRVIYINKLEEPYTGKATIHLDNHDGFFNGTDYKGSMAEIIWAWTGGTGSTDEPVWVVNQKNISVEGKQVLVLDCLSAWELMEKSTGINVADETDMVTAGYGITRIYDRDTTVKDIITEIATGTGSFLEQWGLTTVTTIVGEPAGTFAIQTYQPQVFTRLNEDDRTIIRRLLQMTESVITLRWASGLTFNFIDESLPGPYYTYENDAIEHPFFVNIFGEAVIVPNYIIFVDQEPNPLKDEEANFVGSAELATMPLGRFGIVIPDPTIEDDAEATHRAEAFLKRVSAEALIGELYVPMNCCAELYDEIEIIDNRTGVTSYGRIGSIERTYIADANSLEPNQSQREGYTSRIKLGGIGGGSTRIESLAGGINDIETTILDLKGRSLIDPFRDTPQINASALSQHIAPQLYVDTCSATETLSNGLVHTITGCSRDITPNPYAGDIVLKVRGNFYIDMSAGGAPGDIFACYLYVEGAQSGQSAPFHAWGNGAGVMITKEWRIPLVADGTTYTIELRAQRISGAGTWHVITPNTDMTIEVLSDKNLVIS